MALGITNDDRGSRVALLFTPLSELLTAAAAHSDLVIYHMDIVCVIGDISCVMGDILLGYFICNHLAIMLLLS